MLRKQKQKTTQPGNPQLSFFELLYLHEFLCFSHYSYGSLPSESCQYVSANFYILGMADLPQGVSHGYVLDDCYHSRDIVGSGILCSAWRRRIDTSAACDCRDCNSLSAFDWKTYFERREKIELVDCSLC